MSNLILFDLDHTLINTRQLFEEGFHQRVNDLVPNELAEVQELMNRYWKQFKIPQDFKWAGYARHIEVELGLTPEQVKGILEDPELYQSATYPDMQSTFEELRSRGYRFGIWSEGDPEFQLLKVKLSGIEEWVDRDELYISRNKIAPEVLANLPAATVVDDRLRVLEKLTDERWLPIWLNRRQEERPDTWAQKPMIKELSDLSEFL